MGNIMDAGNRSKWKVTKKNKGAVPPLEFNYTITLGVRSKRRNPSEFDSALAAGLEFLINHYIVNRAAEELTEALNRGLGLGKGKKS